MITRISHFVLNLVCPRPALRQVGLGFTYVTIFAASLWLSYQLRFDFHVPADFEQPILRIVLLAIGIKILCMYACHQFDGLLSFFSVPDLKNLLAATVTASALLMGLWAGFGLEFAPPRSVLLADSMISMAALTSLRLGLREMRMITRDPHFPGVEARGVAIVGAGNACSMLVRELLTNRRLGLRPVALFDDRHTTGCRMHGLPLMGPPEKIVHFKEKLGIAEVIIAMPSAPAWRVREILEICRRAKLPCRTVPSLHQLATGRVEVSNLRSVEIGDLLGRAAVEIDPETVRGVLAGKKVMVTGAGGSIGSELCRQILQFSPAALFLVERSEPNLFAIEQELLRLQTRSPVVPLLGDVTNADQMAAIFERFRPEVVFHAAAHKHVTMMEKHPDEAIRNNVLGTALTLDLAIEFGIERFVMISTDKAVNPKNAMGASKRFAEMYLQARSAQHQRTKMMTVRFGNVLGSSGSVVPIFSAQIAAGGPVTVTHPEVTRFFMTIPEAATLVLQSSAFGNGGEVFLLEMGHPVKITDLARQMITLSGLRPEVDIDIVFTGLRPGEKLHERLSHRWEETAPTNHPKILRLVSTAPSIGAVNRSIEELRAAAAEPKAEPEALKQMLLDAVAKCQEHESREHPEPRGAEAVQDELEKIA